MPRIKKTSLFTEEELQVLAVLVAHVGGDMQTSYRTHTESVLQKLVSHFEFDSNLDLMDCSWYERIKDKLAPDGRFYFRCGL